jgi:hypothetical protein
VGNSTALTEGEWILVEETIFLSTVWEFRCDSSLIPWKKSESFPRGTNGFQEWIRSAGGGVKLLRQKAHSKKKQHGI